MDSSLRRCSTTEEVHQTRSIKMVSSCSTEEKKKKTKHVVIAYTSPIIQNGRRLIQGEVIFLPISPQNSVSNPIHRLLPNSQDLIEPATCTVANSRLYFIGSLPPLDKRVSSYTFTNQLTFTREKDQELQFGVIDPLLTEIEGSIYALASGSGSVPSFQKYDVAKREWIIQTVFNVDKCACDQWTRDNLGLVPHVVIGHKLHVSIGDSSLVFDTRKCVWRESHLFKTFWTSKATKKSGLSQTNFYGGEIWEYAGRNKRRRGKFNQVFGFSATGRVLNGMRVKRNRKTYYGGHAFGFSGKGVLWGKNILLGVHQSYKCLVVAFLLDNKGSVVRSQQIIEVDSDSNYCSRGGAVLVDIGRDGFFALVHTLSDADGAYDLENPGLEIVVFSVKKLGEINGECNFLECKVKWQDFVVKDLGDIRGNYTAACV